MPVDLTCLSIGQGYDRPTLARLWGLGGSEAISRGVFTPAGRNLIILFVTREKQQCLTQYVDFLEEDILVWDGEQGHRSDRRIQRASEAGDEIHLFYRERHHAPFTYHGRIVVTQFLLHADRPSEFAFKVVALEPRQELRWEAAEEEADYVVASEAALAGMDRQIVANSRGIAQRIFRSNMLRRWQGCCAVTCVHEPQVLRACHVKPWVAATPVERLDVDNGLLLVPNLDALFEVGLIGFRDDGSLLFSNRFGRDDRRRMHITADLHLREVGDGMRPYLEFHRERWGMRRS